MSDRPLVCITFFGDPDKDSRLSRMLGSLSHSWQIVVLIPECYGKGTGFSADLRHLVPTGKGGLRFALPRYWRAARQIARELNPDLFLSSDLYTLPAASRAAGDLGIALLFDSRELYSSIAALHHRPITQRFWSSIQSRGLRNCMGAMAVNEHLALELQASFPRLPVTVIPNYPRLQALPDSSPLREAINLPDGHRILLFQGGLQEGRGALPILQALPQLPGWELVYLGEGGLREVIREKADELGLSNRVHVLPAVPSQDLLAWTCGADLGLCLVEDRGESYRHSLPNKLFEYVHASVPVVASPLPEISTFVNKHGVGIVARDWSPEALTEAVLQLTGDSRRYQEARLRCRQARDFCSWENIEPTFLDLCKDALSHQSVPI